jgi:hypothetical protein
MLKPTMAAVIGLVCVAAVMTGTGGPWGSGAEGSARIATNPIERGAVPGAPPGVEQSFAHVPAVHAAYGWRYASAFHWESSLSGLHPSVDSVHGRAEGR